MNLNQISLVGNITKDPEIRFTSSGKAVAEFGLAVNHSKKVDNKWESTPTFYNVTVWDDYAENITESISKGVRVVVIGRLETQTYQNKDGEDRSKQILIASVVAVDLKFTTVTVHRNERRGVVESSERTLDLDEAPF